MVYRRSYGRRRYGRKRASAKGGWAGVARKALRVANFVRTLVNVERKFFDVDGTTATNFSATGTVFPLTGIAQGDAFNQRDGNSIKLVSQFARMQCVLNSLNLVGDSVRFIVFSDNENQGANPAVLDVLEVANVISPINHVNGKRFTVWYDKIKTLTQEGTEINEFKMYKKCQHHIKYSAGLATNTREGNLFALAISANATNLSTYTIYNRVRFIDN